VATSTFISRLSHMQRRVLFEHIEGPKAIDTSDSHRQQTLKALSRVSLIRGFPYGARRPSATELTNEGREVVAKLLSEYAETLIRAGCLDVDEKTAEELKPFRMLARLKAVRANGRLLPKKADEVAEPKELGVADDLDSADAKCA